MRPALLGGLMLAGACSGGGPGPDLGESCDGGAPTQLDGGSASCAKVTFTQVKQTVLRTCGSEASGTSGGCHRRAPFDGQLNLTDGQAYPALVNQPAVFGPGRTLVKPCAPAASFLFVKLSNAHGHRGAGDAGGRGDGLLPAAGRAARAGAVLDRQRRPQRLKLAQPQPVTIGGSARGKTTQSSGPPSSQTSIANCAT